MWDARIVVAVPSHLQAGSGSAPFRYGLRLTRRASRPQLRARNRSTLAALYPDRNCSVGKTRRMNALHPHADRHTKIDNRAARREMAGSRQSGAWDPKFCPDKVVARCCAAAALLIRSTIYPDCGRQRKRHDVASPAVKAAQNPVERFSAPATTAAVIRPAEMVSVELATR
jgi:hypothetical protein